MRNTYHENILIILIETYIIFYSLSNFLFILQPILSDMSRYKLEIRKKCRII